MLKMSSVTLIILVIAACKQLSCQDILVKDLIRAPYSATVNFQYVKPHMIEELEFLLNGTRLDTYNTSNLPPIYNLSQLEPCTAYNLSLRTYASDTSRKNFEVDFIIKSVNISSVENFEYAHGVLKWTRPNQGAICIKTYNLYYEGIQRNSDKETVSLTDLPGCSKVQITIAPVNLFGVSGVNTTKVIQTEFKEPDRLIISVDNFTDPKSLTISWNSPNKKHNCVKHYAIRYDAKPVTFTNLSSFKIEKPQPCQIFNITICIVKLNDEYGKCTEHVESMKFEKPGLQIGSRKVDSFSINISLEYQNKKCWQFIHISIDHLTKDSFSQPNLPQYYYVNYLTPCTTYNLLITAYKVNSRFGNRIKTNLTTKSVALNDTVHDVKFDRLNNLVIWQRPRFGANCISHYYIDYGGQKLKQFDEKFPLRELPGCSSFEIIITPVGLNNLAGISKFKVLETGFKEPNHIENVYILSYSPTSITMKWNIPSKNPKCVKSYAIECNQKTGHTNLTEYKINNLEPCTYYDIRICNVLMNNEIGVCTDHFKNVSTQSVVPKVVIGKVISKSFFLNVTLAYENVNCIEQINISLRNEKRATLTRSNLPEDYHVYKLNPCINYILTLYVSSHKYAKMITVSKMIMVSSTYEVCNTTEEDNDIEDQNYTKYIQNGLNQPGHRTNFIAFASSPQSISMAWNGPKENPNCVMKYAIKYNNVIESKSLTEDTRNNLDPCIKYRIRICILMINRESEICMNESSVTTTAGIPSRVEDLRYNNSLIEWIPSSYVSWNRTTKYVLTVYDEFGSQIISKELTKSKFEINTGLLRSCQLYIVSVIPVNVDNVRGVGSTITFQIEPSKPTLPSAPQLISKTSHSFELSLYYDNNNDLCRLQGVCFLCCSNNSRCYGKYISLTQNGTTFNATIRNLTDYTTYSCTVKVSNFKYVSNESRRSVFETKEKRAEPPNLSISSIKSTSLSFKWTHSKHRIKLKSYYVHIQKIGKNYDVPRQCQTVPFDEIFSVDPDKVTHEVKNLEPYTKYSLKMAIENSVGIGPYSKPIEVITKPDTPHRLNEFRINRINMDHTVELKWEWPCEINGQIISIHVKVDDNRYNVSRVDLLSMNLYKVPQIKPEYFYNITIGIEIQNFTGPMNETSVSFTSPPKTYAMRNWGYVLQKTSSKNSVKLKVFHSIFKTTKAKIKKFTFLISERNCQSDPQPNYKSFSDELNHARSRTWYDFVDAICAGQYQIQEFFIDDHFDTNTNFELILGYEICDETKKYRDFCNGPFKSGTEYAVIARVYTAYGYADTNPIIFTIENSFPTITVICFIFLLLGIFGGVFIIRHKFYKSNTKSELELSDQVDNIITFKLDMYHRFLKVDLKVIEDEFNLINALDVSRLTTNEAEKHKTKNRYLSVLPYDATRVRLTPNTYILTDYINASFIGGYTSPKEYIASQAPIHETFYEFWSMIIEMKCHKIVMLTKLFENQVLKCDQYYPDPEKTLELHDISITNDCQINYNLYTKRKLKITRGVTEPEHIVKQYHFEKWPDHGCPENELVLLSFLKKVRSGNNSSGPILVHCSAGVGRTGTLIALDIIIQQIKNGENLNICETVKSLRHQRTKMVHSLEQYQFIYKCVARHLDLKMSNANI